MMDTRIICARLRESGELDFNIGALDVEPRRDAERLRLPQAEAKVHLVTQSGFTVIEGCSDSVHVLTSKDPRKALGFYLLQRNHRGRLPLIRADFVDAAACKRSLRKLLGQAVRRGVHLSAVIQVPAAVFEALAAEYPDRSSANRGRGSANYTNRMIAALDAVMGGDDARGRERYAERLATLEKTLLGSSQEMELVRRLILSAESIPNHEREAARPVLVCGETGTGKRKVAEMLHQHAWRFLGEPITFNCAAMPESLFDSELFGYVKGAFTGADQDRLGAWRSADGGTLFLDEVGELTLPQQAKVLRVFDVKRVRPLGSTDEKPVTARLVTATNRDLAAMVSAGSFRADLYQRLVRGLVITVPPLRHNPADIAIVARGLWRQMTGGDGDLSEDVVALLSSFSWPRNVRQLKSVLERVQTLFRHPNKPEAEQIRLVLETEAGFEALAPQTELPEFGVNQGTGKLVPAIGVR